MVAAVVNSGNRIGNGEGGCVCVIVCWETLFAADSKALSPKPKSCDKGQVSPPGANRDERRHGRCKQFGGLSFRV